ncbi:MAG TPA: DUF3566 domain-containing protein [Nocardioidaceae bacterium]|jgi:hypothetical protein|nr:DUF3566 domain-containing protein [Nocardioidaceae bacterium]
MADRRTNDTPLAPRRSLGAPARSEEQLAGGSRRPLSERVSAAISTAGSAVSNATANRSGGSTGGPERPERAESGQGTREMSLTGGRGRSEPRRQGPSPAGRGRTRKARLRLTHIDPWSVMKTAFLLSIALGIVTVIAVAVVWSVLGAAGVWDSINNTVQEVLGGETAQSFNVEDYVGTSRVMGFTMIVAVVDVVLITAIATLGAFLYNLAAALLGGLEVTLAEDER